MFEKIRKMKNKKGFTLVELIVVLVILAILAALLIPALTGYIDKARKQVSDFRGFVGTDCCAGYSVRSLWYCSDLEAGTDGVITVTR